MVPKDQHRVLGHLGGDDICGTESRRGKERGLFRLKIILSVCIYHDQIYKGFRIQL